MCYTILSFLLGGKIQTSRVDWQTAFIIHNHNSSEPYSAHLRGLPWPSFMLIVFRCLQSKSQSNTFKQPEGFCSVSWTWRFVVLWTAKRSPLTLYLKHTQGWGSPKAWVAEALNKNAYLVNEDSICASSGGLTSFLLLPNFRNHLGNILSCAILELLLVVAIETKICEGVWWWEAPRGDHS